MTSPGGLLIGILNIFLFVAIFILVGVIVRWGAKLLFQTDIPADVVKWYLVVVGVMALIMVVMLLLTGNVPYRVVGGAPFWLA